MIYVCELCGWEYDEMLGVPDMDIVAGTKFHELPTHFECPLCSAGKADFSLKED